MFITDDPDEAAELRERWERQVPGVPLVIVESPYRALAGPLLAYLDVLDRAWPPDKPEPITFVVIPEYVARSWWERILYNQSAKRLRTVLLGRPHTVVVDVPYRREEPAASDGRTDPGRAPADARAGRGDRPSVRAEVRAARRTDRCGTRGGGIVAAAPHRSVLVRPSSPTP